MTRFAFFLLFLSVGTASAQPVAPDVACTYTDCAVRLEPAFFRGLEIIRGVPGEEEVVGRVGYLGGGLVDYLEPVPEAAGHAASSRRYQMGGFALAAGAGLALGVYSASQYGSDDLGRTTTYFVGALVAGVVSSALLIKGQREQARAVWTYNEAVARR